MLTYVLVQNHSTFYRTSACNIVLPFLSVRLSDRHVLVFSLNEDQLYDPGQGAKKDLTDTGDDFLAIGPAL